MPMKLTGNVVACHNFRSTIGKVELQQRNGNQLHCLMFSIKRNVLMLEPLGNAHVRIPQGAALRIGVLQLSLF